MNILFVLIPLGIGMAAVSVWAFFWAVDNGQFDDLETPATRVLDDETERPRD
jgi:cbb3-type cytochrome oxidase maturation protein